MEGKLALFLYSPGPYFTDEKTKAQKGLFNFLKTDVPWWYRDFLISGQYY